MTLKEAYNYGVYFLSANGVDEADFKSKCLVCNCFGIKNSQYHQHVGDEITTKRFSDMLWRVKQGEPLQYVLGEWDFYKSTFYVGEGVLIPRPETEELTQLAVDFLKNKKNPVVFDLCSGTGCIGLSVAKEYPDSTVFLVEKSDKAFEYLLKNAQAVPNANCVLDDIANESCVCGNADLIVSNPPYIKSEDISYLQSEVRYEPRIALDGGEDGLYFYKILSSKWKSRLKSGGEMLLEIGNNQGEAVSSMFENANVIKDIYGNDRIVKIN